uniref:Uncharacterized protein n=1 Tax=Cannabis sativa TaxID=3483 RepID=A0A803P4E5_CANSA
MMGNKVTPLVERKLKLEPVCASCRKAQHRDWRPSLAGNLRKALERNERSLRHKERGEVLEVAEHPPKTQRYECDLITFRDFDSYHVSYPHSDPLLVKGDEKGLYCKSWKSNKDL